MLLTVFTPTYNRAYTLPNLYSSLCRQSETDFCWLVIDDGSTDDTEEIVKNWIEENIISIKYFKQENSGKHVARNRAIEECDTELLMCVDSDDKLTVDAVEIIKNKNSDYSDSKILGLYFRRVFENGENIASAYPKGIKTIGVTDLYHQYKFSGDTSPVLRTKMIKGIKSPVFEGEKFLTERIYYNMLNHIAPMVLCEEGIYVCEYLPDGLSNNMDKIIKRIPYGYTLDFLSEAVYEYRLVDRVKNAAKYYAYKRKLKLDSKKFSYFTKPPVYIRFIGILLSVPYKAIKL